MFEILPWKDVCVPSSLVNSIKALPPCVFLDTLVYQLVFRNKRRAQHHYACDVCGYHWRPQRMSEEVTYCLSCNSPRLRTTSTLRFGKEVPAYSKKTGLFQDVLIGMKTNYLTYFGVAPTPMVDCGWDGDKVYAKFAGGESIIDLSPRMCLIKAVICCPFLWDRSFDWSQAKGVDKVNTDHISPILASFGNGSWLGKPE